MDLHQTRQKLRRGARQLQTRATALHALYTLDQADIDAFMNSYVLFDGDWSKQNGRPCCSRSGCST